MNYLPPSSQEVYGKHRSQDDIKAIERQNRVLEARSFRYGDPVNSRDKSRDESPASRNAQVIEPERKTNKLLLIFRYVASLF
jgi:hypothetical protein